VAPRTAGGPSYVSGRPGRPGRDGAVPGVSCRGSEAADSPETRVKEVASLREPVCPGGTRLEPKAGPAALRSGQRVPASRRRALRNQLWLVGVIP
jgi:hypothetical protein